MDGSARPLPVVPDLPSALSTGVQSRVLKDILSVVAEALDDEGYLDLREAFIDGSFAPETKIMAIAGRHGLPVAVVVESAAPHEVTLVKATVAQTLVRKKPEHLVGDAACESDRLDAELARHGIELIAPDRSNRKRKTQVRGDN